MLPQTAARLGVKNIFDPAENIDAGTHYLSELLRRYNNNLVLTLAAYNAGPQSVQRYGRVPPFRETQTYVSRVGRCLRSAQVSPAPSGPERHLCQARYENDGCGNPRAATSVDTAVTHFLSTPPGWPSALDRFFLTSDVPPWYTFSRKILRREALGAFCFLGHSLRTQPSFTYTYELPFAQHS